jgi:flagellar biosynthesis chaperone FliJ
MPQFDRFIDNLIEMRSHYSKQVQQSNRTVNLAQDSLTHINALLVNELSGNQPFVEKGATSE